jgi:lipopolysaccharide export system protein LptA
MTIEKTRIGRGLKALMVAAVVAGAGLSSAHAQTKPKQTGTLPSAFQGLGVASNKPIQFEAEALEVRDQENMAVFSGNVVARQEQTILKTDQLYVYYLEDQANQAQPGQGGQQVKRLEAKGKVLVTSGPQTASGNEAVFDTAANTIVLTGNVVLTQGENVIRGPKLVINIDSGQARMEGGRVQMLIEPKSVDEPKSGG